jgi:hypothetical protein
MGLALAARSSGENNPRYDVVAHSPVARWRLGGDKVLLVSIGEASGRRRAWSWGTKLIEKGSSAVRRLVDEDAVAFQRWGDPMGGRRRLGVLLQLGGGGEG